MTEPVTIQEISARLDHLHAVKTAVMTLPMRRRLDAEIATLDVKLAERVWSVRAPHQRREVAVRLRALAGLPAFI